MPIVKYYTAQGCLAQGIAVYLRLPPKSLYRMDSCEILLKNTTDQKASQSIRLQNSDNYLTIK